MSIGDFQDTRTMHNASAKFDITLVGEINLDLILYGLRKEMPVERELLATDFKMTLGSSSAILAHNLATLGISVGFVTRVGRDEFGAIALARLAESGVDLSRTAQSDNATGTGVTMLLPHGNERHILTYPGTMAELTCADLDREYLTSANHFHLSSLFLQTGLHSGLRELFIELKSHGMTLSLDTNDDPEDRWGGILDEALPLVDLLLPNQDELLRIAKTTSISQALEKIGKIVPLIAVKCGSKGALVHEKGKTTEVPPVLVSPVDTIGAGDSFNSGFLSAYLSGKPATFCAAAGNVTGALSTLAAGGTEAFRNTALRDKFLQEHWPQE